MWARDAFEMRIGRPDEELPLANLTVVCLFFLELTGYLLGLED